MPGRQHLFVPGPSEIPERVLQAMSHGAESHRSVSFPDVLRPLLSSVQRLFDTDSRVAVLPATGTGGWEAALTNTVEPGAELLLVGAGHFSDLWCNAAGKLGYVVSRFGSDDWGEVPDVGALEEHLKSDAAADVAAVLVVHNETSTGVAIDLPTIRGALDGAGHPALLISDGVSAIGSLPYHHDSWGVDVALTGSQKGLGMPTGLALLALSERALERVEAVRSPRSYFDLVPILAENDGGYYPFTPPTQLLRGLGVSLDLLFEEGLEAVWLRHHRLADGVRAAVDAWGLQRCCREWRDASDTVTTVMLPESVDAAQLIGHAHRQYQLDLGSGLGRLSGRAFRIGHIGQLNEGMVLGALGLVELSLSDLGFRVPFGSGAAAALRCWAEAE